VESDEALLMAYRAGDARAFERLVARHEKPVWNFLRRFVANAATAEDLLQEVFLRVIKSANEQDSEWRGAAKFSTWLYTIARNLCVDHARRAVHRDAASLDGPGHGRAQAETESEATLHDRIASSDPAPDAAVADRQAKARIDAAIAALPHDQREVFLMREVMEMPFAEIAAAVGVSEPTVKSRMRYALEKLRAALVELGGDEAGKTESSGSG
jgi:RNA polymerase sigma-70 factor (ECF subfamily)